MVIKHLKTIEATLIVIVILTAIILFVQFFKKPPNALQREFKDIAKQIEVVETEISKLEDLLDRVKRHKRQPIERKIAKLEKLHDKLTTKKQKTVRKIRFNILHSIATEFRGRAEGK